MEAQDETQKYPFLAGGEDTEVWEELRSYTPSLDSMITETDIAVAEEIEVVLPQEALEVRMVVMASRDQVVMLEVVVVV